MKLQTLALLLFVASTTAIAGCGSKKSNNTSSASDANIVPGSDETVHDGQSGPIYEISHPADCGTCGIAPTTDVTGCSAIVGTSAPCEGTCFVDSNIMTTYTTMPPSSGPEYDFYDYNFYDVTTLPEGEYVRNLYHGYIVIAYNCTENCNDMLANITPYGTLGQTPLPGYGVIVTPDANLPANTFYAISWTWSYEFTTFDKATLECFIQQHYGQGLDGSSDTTSTDPNATTVTDSNTAN